MNNVIKIDIWVGVSGANEKRDQLLKYWGRDASSNGLPDNNFVYYQGQRHLGDKPYNIISLTGNWKDDLIKGIKATEDVIENIKSVQLTGFPIDTAVIMTDGLIKNPRSFVDNGYTFFYIGLYSVIGF
jgi:hypothetical protein